MLSHSLDEMSGGADFERAKAYFQQSDAQGQSLYSHLASIILQLTQQASDSAAADPITALASASLAIKQSHMLQQRLSELPVSTSLPPQQARLLSYVNSLSSLLSPALSPFPSASALPATVSVQSLLPYAPLLSAAGVSLPPESLLTLSCSLQSVAAQFSLSNIRLWGVVHTTSGSDYLVLESARSPVVASPPPPVKRRSQLASLSRDEPAGSGVNSSVYYVSNAVTGPWSPLPEARAELLATSRDLHRLLSGRRDAEVSGHPVFAGSEEDLLRCIVARVSHGAFAAPKGSFTVEERPEEAGGGEAVVEDASWEGAAGAEVTELSGWMHLRPKISKKGRTTPFVLPEVEETEEEKEAEPAEAAEAEQEEEDEEPVPALSPLDGDEPPSSSLPAFTVRSSLPASHPHAVTSVRSVLWPGAVSACKGRQTLSLYVGWGVKYRGGGVGGWRRRGMDVMGEEWQPPADGEEEDAAAAQLVEQDDVLEKQETEEEQKEAGEEEEEEDEEEDEAEEA